MPPLKSYVVAYSEWVDWAAVTGFSDFTYPWEMSEPPVMVFKAMHDSSWLLCHFEVIDGETKVFVNDNSKEEVVLGDRVEMFFRQDEKMNPYYCLEIDPLGRIYDYRATWYRQFEPQWSWPAGQLEVEVRKTNYGYTVNIRISLRSLSELGVLRSGELQVGIFRGRCVSPPDVQWISWVRPSSELPDFHIPSAFGVLKLGIDKA